MRFRGKSIRRKIVALLLVPLLSLSVLWALSSALTGSESVNLIGLGHVVTKAGDPALSTVAAIQQERRDTLVYLADPTSADSLKQLQDTRSAADRNIAALKKGASGIRGRLDSATLSDLDAFLDTFGKLDQMRAEVDNNTATRDETLDYYDGVIDPAYTFLADVYGREDVDGDNRGRAVIGLDRAQEMFSREDAVVVSGLVARRLSAGDVRTVTDLIADRNLLYDTSLADLPSSDRSAVKRAWASPAAVSLGTTEQRIVTTGVARNPRTVTAQGWQDMSSPVAQDLAKAGAKADIGFQDHIGPLRRNVFVRFAIAGALGLVALLASLVVSVRVGRELIRDLSQLRRDAQEASEIRLPGVMRRLAAGELIDLDAEAPVHEYREDEIGQVGQALGTLQRAAVEAAVKQADLRRGVAEVFVNLARRNQVLLHRQLTLLDSMERRTEDTAELADLFRLDHLTTRMRRHAEGLVILSGAAPSRQWRQPVQLMDVVRAAVAEVEDYERIEVRRLPRIGVGGPAVADLTHLFAELLENATVFSPPHTTVQVMGERVPNGFTLEIHDRGLGMNPEALLEANLRLAETPEFELSDTDRLGLFVISRLAQRQSVRVSLQPSPYGGTTAVVFLPGALLTDAPDTETDFRLDRGHGALPAHDREAAHGEPAELTTGDGWRRSAPWTREPHLREARLESQHQPADQHQHAPDSLLPGHDGPLPRLPRRNPPTLVADRGRRLDEQEGRTHPAPPGEHEEPGEPASAPAAPPEQAPQWGRPAAAGLPSVREPQETSAAAETPAGSIGGLPRRVRQASLAPQLRENGPERDAAPAPRAERSEDRDADEVRSRMASLQQGWQRGRRDNEADDATARPAETQATTSEGDGR
jgi:Nitrate and nitrite sensing